MKIAVLSGKGGTGKTLLAVNLAAVEKTSTYIDCDVEEPNGHLFFKPNDLRREEVSVKIPKVEEELCNGCRECVEFCNFNALAYTGKSLIVFDEICHSCGGCTIICPQKALWEREKVIGKIERGISNNVTIYTGLLNIGEASGIPIIKELLNKSNREIEKTTIIDCPPGSACIVMESIRDADYCILVAEPTVFGVHNLKMVYELVKLFKKPFGIVLNKYINEENPAQIFAIEENIKILASIPFDSEIGEINSKGEILVNKSEKYNKVFSSLLEKVKEEVDYERTTNS